MKKIIMVSLCIILWSGQALAFRVFAGCSRASITANTPTSDFIVNNNGTVIHTKTGLMWKRCSEGQTWSGITCSPGIGISYTWKGALDQAKVLNKTGGFAGFYDWRIPNQKELSSIVENQCYNPSINTIVFPATMLQGYWTASPVVRASPVFFCENFGCSAIKVNTYYVRLVRGGQ